MTSSPNPSESSTPSSTTPTDSSSPQQFEGKLPFNGITEEKFIELTDTRPKPPNQEYVKQINKLDTNLFFVLRDLKSYQRREANRAVCQLLEGLGFFKTVDEMKRIWET